MCIGLSVSYASEQNITLGCLCECVCLYLKILLTTGPIRFSFTMKASLRLRKSFRREGGDYMGNIQAQMKKILDAPPPPPLNKNLGYVFSRDSFVVN